MRSLDECRVEVFRRSEERIEKRRKQRKWVLACCVPMMLCLAVLTVLMLPRTTDMAPSNGAPEMIGGVNGGTSVVEIRRTGGLDQYRAQVTDPVQVGEIYNVLQLLLGQDGAENESATGSTMDGSLLPPADPPELGGGYTITFFDSGEVYTLSGNELTDGQSGQTVELSETQLAQLKELLGLA